MMQLDKLKKKITVNYKFRGLHRWRDCPFNSVDFLKDLHHHQFEVTATLWVNDSDRQFEFIRIQHLLELIVHNCYPNYNEQHKDYEDQLSIEIDKFYPNNKYIPYTANVGGESCEMIAEDILIPLYHICGVDMEVTVSEDGHYSGTVSYKENN